jgi:hypothetical protein
MQCDIVVSCGLEVVLVSNKHQMIKVISVECYTFKLPNSHMLSLSLYCYLILCCVLVFCLIFRS